MKKHLEFTSSGIINIVLSGSLPHLRKSVSLISALIIISLFVSCTNKKDQKPDSAIPVQDNDITTQYDQNIKTPELQTDLKLIGQLKIKKSSEISGSQWGVSCHWIVDPHDLTTDQQVQQLAWLGAKYGFLCSDWDKVEGKKGKYDFNTPTHKFDDAVFGMAKRGIEPVIQVYGGNRLYMPYALDVNNRQMADADKLLNDPETRKAWIAYLKTMVTRYKDHVKAWEIWNEPNSDYFWQKDGKRFEPSVEVYGSVLKMAAETIRSVQPDAIIIAGSTAHVKKEYLKGFLNSEGGDYYDYWSIHPYGEVPEAYDPKIIEVQNILKEFGKTSVMWQSECGFPSDGNTGGWGWAGPWNETKQAKWVLRRFLSDAKVGLKPSIYFCLNDYPTMLEFGPDAGKMGNNAKGLFTNKTWKPKISAYAFRNLSSVIDDKLEEKSLNISFKTAIDSTSAHLRSYTLKEKSTGSPVVVYWLDIPMETNFKTQKIQIDLQNYKIDQPVLVDLLDGHVYNVLVDKEGQKVFKELPVTDSPLVLCSRSLIELAPKDGQ